MELEQSTPINQISLKFCAGSQVRHETPEKGRRTYYLRCGFNSEDEDNSPNILSEKESDKYVG